MLKAFDAAIDPSNGILTLTGELSSETSTPLIPFDTPFEIGRSKVVRTAHGSIRFTVNVIFMGTNFMSEIEKQMVGKKVLKP